MFFDFTRNALSIDTVTLLFDGTGLVNPTFNPIRLRLDDRSRDEMLLQLHPLVPSLGNRILLFCSLHAAMLNSTRLIVPPYITH